MAFPAPVLPSQKWLYVGNTKAILGNNSTINPNPQLVTNLLCYAYAQGYTGLFLYEMNSSPWRSSNSNTFDGTNAKAKLANFIAQASAMGIAVGGVTDSKPVHQDCFIDYNNNYAAANEKFSAIAIENEWYWYSYDNAAVMPAYPPLPAPRGPGQPGTYSFTVMKANLLGRKVALNAAGMASYLYYGWPRANGEVYNSQVGMDGSTVTGGSEISQLNGVCDYHMPHDYNGVLRPGYSFIRTRLLDYTYPVNILPILSAEPAFSANFFEGKDAGGNVIYPKKNIINGYEYIITDQTANLPAGSSTYFNNETNAGIRANVNIVGIVLFTYGQILPLSSGNGPQVWIDAGPDIIVGSSPGTVTVTATSCDDGLPVGSFTTYAWGLYSGISGSFTAPTSLTTDFSFPSDGIYELIIFATNSGVTSSSIMTIYVNSVASTKTLIFGSKTPNSGVPVTLSILDNNGLGSGNTFITRVYDTTVPLITATVPASAGGNAFWKWTRDGVDFSFSRSIDITDNADHAFRAMYASLLPGDAKIRITSNFNDTTFTVNVPDNNGAPVGLTGTVFIPLHYTVGQAVQFTVPATHPVTGTAFQAIQVNFVTVSVTPTLNYTAVNGDIIFIIYATAGVYPFSSVNVVDEACGGSGGSIGLPAGADSYLWSTGATTNSITGIPAGIYSVAVTYSAFANPVLTYTNIVVESAIPIVATVATLDALCGADGSALVTVSGGKPPYTYLWSSGETVDAITHPAGGVSVTVTDDNMCAVIVGGTIASSAGIDLLSYTIDQPLCEVSPTGGITIDLSGGGLPYSYLWTKVSDPLFTAPDANQITGLDAGTYNVDVTAQNGCTKSFGPFVVDPAYPLVITASSSAGSLVCDSQEVTLNLDTVTINGVAVTPSSILWSTGGIAASEYLGFLSPGSYLFSVTVIAGGGCAASVDIPLNVVASPASPIVITLDTAPSACAGTDYELSSTGTAGYTSFVWMPTLETTTDISGLSSSIVVPTEFYIIGFGTGGCQVESNRITVNPSPATAISLVAAVGPVCNGAPDTGTISVDVSGGCPPYTYAWSGPGGFTATTKDITGLITGTYTLIATDSLLQTDTLPVDLVVSSPVVSAVVTNSGCPGSNSGVIEATTVGGTPPYTYQWNTGQTTAIITGLAVGSYEVTSTDANGCTSSNGYYVSESSPVTVSFRVRNPTAIGINDGVITAIGAGGVPSYGYLWSSGEAVDTITNLGPGTYTVQVTDQNGCQCIGAATILTSDQEELSTLNCCAGDMAYLYVWQMQNGKEKEACLTMARLKLLNGYIGDICRYEPDTCLTAEQLEMIKEKARYLCKCCGCGDDMYDDSILP